MRVVLLGTGTLVPEPDRAATGLLVEADGEVVAIDLGRGVLGRMAEAGQAPTSLRRIFFSHLHADHTADLVSLLFAFRHARSAPGPVELCGPRGLGELVAGITRTWPSTAPDYDLRIRETDGGRLADGGAVVEAGPVHHGGHAALGYRVREGSSGRVVAFTGDSGPGPDLERLVAGADLLVAECGDGLGPSSGRHLDVEALASLVESTGAGRAAVIHIDPRQDRVAILRALRRRLGERIVEGRDGLELDV